MKVRQCWLKIIEQTSICVQINGVLLTRERLVTKSELMISYILITRPFDSGWHCMEKSEICILENFQSKKIMQSTMMYKKSSHVQQDMKIIDTLHKDA